MKTFQKHQTTKNSNKTDNNQNLNKKKVAKYTLIIKPKVFISPPAPHPKPPSPIPNQPPPQSPTNNLIKVQNQQTPRTMASPNLNVGAAPPNKGGVGLRSSFVEILARHKAFFGLENQARIIEKTLQQSKNTLEKDLERQRKRSLCMDTPLEPSTATKRSLMASPYMPTKNTETLPTPEECQCLTKKTNNMVAEEVKNNLNVASGKIDALLVDLEPGKRKIKAKRMEDRLKKKPLQDLTLRFRDLSLSSGDAKKNF